MPSRRHALALLAACALATSAHAASATKAAACGQAASLLAAHCRDGGAAVATAAACCVPYRALATLGCACDMDTLPGVQTAVTGHASAGLVAACGVRAPFASLVEQCAAPPPARAAADGGDFDADPFTALFRGASDWATAAVAKVTDFFAAAAAPFDAATLADVLTGGVGGPLPLWSTLDDDDDDDFGFDFDDDDDVVDVDSPAQLRAALDAAGADAAFFAPLATPDRDVVVDVDADDDGALTAAAVARGASGALEAAALDVQTARGAVGARDTMQRLADWVASLADVDAHSSDSPLADALDDAAAVLEAVGDRVAAAVAATPGAADSELTFDVAVDVAPTRRDAKVDVHVESVDGRVPAAVLERALRAAAADAAAAAPAGVTLASSVDVTPDPVPVCAGAGASRWLCQYKDAVAATLAIEVAAIALALCVLMARAVTAPADALEDALAEEEALIGTAIECDEEEAGLRQPLWAVDTKA